MRGAVAIDAVELGTPREAPSLRRHHSNPAGRPSSRREAFPAFGAPPLQDRAAPARPHPRPEPVGLGPLALLRLIGALHWASQYTEAPGDRPKSFPRHLRLAADSAGRGAAMVARRCPTTRLHRTSTPSGRMSSDGCGWPSPSRPSRSGWSRCGRSAAQGTTLYLAAPEGIQTWVERRYAPLLREALAERSRR